MTKPFNNSNEAALKKTLEWELSLDSKDVRSHAWYHGTLTRQRAEEIVQKDGDFLLRDCVSQPGNYVLTCRSKNTVLHFVINKVLIQAETVYERIQYQFEDDAYETLADLITFYVGSGKPISAASGARIQYPCNRNVPLNIDRNKLHGPQLKHAHTYSEERAASPLNFSMLSLAPRLNSHCQVGGPAFPSPRSKRETGPRLNSKKQRSQSLTPLQSVVSSSMSNVDRYSSTEEFPENGDFCSSADGIIQSTPSKANADRISFKKDSEFINNGHNGFQTIARSTICESEEHLKFTTHSLPRPTQSSFRLSSMRTSVLNSSINDNEVLLSTCMANNMSLETSEKIQSPPPKPVRAPIFPSKRENDLKTETTYEQQVLHRVATYHTSGSDSGNGSGDSIVSFTPGDSNETNQMRGVVIKNPRFMTTSSSSLTVKSSTYFDIAAAESQLLLMEIPEVQMSARFDVENYTTLLLPSVDNKPLDSDALNTFKMMLLESGTKAVAEHITRIDILLIYGDYDGSNFIHKLDPLQNCGLELLVLPHGKTFRNDLVERTQCIRLLVAITVLTCQTDLERAQILNKWIQIAVETKTALGNLFGFCAIMLGLCMPQIECLEDAWHTLRQQFTESAFNFEAKLRPTLKAMNDCSNPQAPNTTVPHLLLYILLKDRSISDILECANTNLQHRSLVNGCIKPWESAADDFGLSINYLHLDSGRSFLKNIILFKKNSKTVLDDSLSRFDDLLFDAFRTEFHIKFLWGSNGACALPSDRHSKMENVLNMMSNKFCKVNETSAA